LNSCFLLLEHPQAIVLYIWLLATLNMKTRFSANISVKYRYVLFTCTSSKDFQKASAFTQKQTLFLISIIHLFHAFDSVFLQPFQSFTRTPLFLLDQIFISHILIQVSLLMEALGLQRIRKVPPL